MSTVDGLSPPLVSVFVVAFNHARFVVETLESVHAQTYRNVQLIIVDDCSEDNSRTVIENWIDARGVKCDFIAHTQNQGICRTLNEALSRARGKYISMIAGDDMWLPEKLEREIAILDAAPDDVGVVYSDAWQAAVNGDRLPGMFIEKHRTFATPPEGDIFEILAHGNFIPAHTALIRRGCFDVVGLYDERLRYEDWDMWLRIAAHFKYVFMPWPCGIYRVVPTSLVHRIGEPQFRNDRLSNDFIILHKCLSVSSITPTLRERLWADLCQLAEKMYSHRAPRRRHFVWRALQTSRNRRLTVMSVMCFLGVPYSVFAALDAVHSYLLDPSGADVS